MSEMRGFLYYIEYGLEKFGQSICNLGAFFKKKWRWSFELRKVVMAIPVIVLMLKLAADCRAELPKKVGLNLLASGSFEYMIARETAITICMAVTCVCLLFMFLSRKTVYPWLISLFSLLLPVLLIITNTFPG